MTGHDDDIIVGKAYDAALMRRLMGYLRPYWLSVLIALAAIVSASVLQLAHPYLMKLAIDRYIATSDLAGMNRIALLFLGVCLVNVVGLLLAKFLNAAPHTGLRRALGASRRDIVRQHMTEVVLLGLAGGMVGLLLAVAGLAGIRALYGSDFNRGAYERLTEIDPVVMLVTLGLSLLAGAVAGLYPSWRIGRTAPAVYLKTQ